MIVVGMRQTVHTTLRGGMMKQLANDEQPKQEQDGDLKKERPVSLAEEQLNRWIDAMERMQLADYIRYVDDRRRLFWSSFWSGIARGVGMAIGFTILGALLILILQDLARHNLPLIGELLDEIVNVVQNRMK